MSEAIRSTENLPDLNPNKIEYRVIYISIKIMQRGSGKLANQDYTLLAWDMEPKREMKE